MTKEELEAFLKSKGVPSEGKQITEVEARMKTGVRCGKCDGADVPQHWFTCPKREGLS